MNPYTSSMIHENFIYVPSSRLFLNINHIVSIRINDESFSVLTIDHGSHKIDLEHLSCFSKIIGDHESLTQPQGDKI